MILSVCCVDSTVPDIPPPHYDTVLSATIHSLHSEYSYLDQKIIMKILNINHQSYIHLNYNRYKKKLMNQNMGPSFEAL